MSKRGDVKEQPMRRRERRIGAREKEEKGCLLESELDDSLFLYTSASLDVYCGSSAISQGWPPNRTAPAARTFSAI